MGRQVTNDEQSKKKIRAEVGENSFFSFSFFRLFYIIFSEASDEQVLNKSVTAVSSFLLLHHLKQLNHLHKLIFFQNQIIKQCLAAVKEEKD